MVNKDYHKMVEDLLKSNGLSRAAKLFIDEIGNKLAKNESLNEIQKGALESTWKRLKN